MRALLAIPVYNEERYLSDVLDEVRKYIRAILVIDDGSTDRTPKILSECRDIAVIRHWRNRGYGQSLVDAFRHAAKQGYDWLITMDCDEQHEPCRIPDFLAAAAVDDADIISGSRYMERTPADDLPPLDRRRINAKVTKLINDVLGLPITDAFCGYKAHRVSALRRLRLTETGYAFPLQFWVQVVRAGLRVREIPVRLIYNDPTRSFGGPLDDPAVRLHHYLAVFYTELGKAAFSADLAGKRAEAACCCGPCQHP
jgi:glycosyltransferase involved in cell wall biosynthesis